jgi:hypothetical protein
VCARARVADNLCDFRFAVTDATSDPVALSAAAQAASFATGNGVPPTVGVNLVYADADRARPRWCAIPVNHASRAYYGANRLAERHGRHSSTRCIEVTNAQHFDAFPSFPGCPERDVPAEGNRIGFEQRTLYVPD